MAYLKSTDYFERTKKNCSHKVKLIMGIIYKDAKYKDKALAMLVKKFGMTDLISNELVFNFTPYYEKEFGKGLKKILLSFKDLVYQKNIFKIKSFTQSLERKLSLNKARCVNIDPGYIALGKLVLLSSKNHYHRIYLDAGIYAEITLRFKNLTFVPLEWTYPDFKTQPYISFFNKARERYKTDLRHLA